MFEVSTSWTNGAGQVLIYCLAIGLGLYIMSKIGREGNKRGGTMTTPKCQWCEGETRIEPLDFYLEELGCEVTCEGCDTLICLECGQDVPSEKVANA